MLVKYLCNKRVFLLILKFNNSEFLFFSEFCKLFSQRRFNCMCLYFFLVNIMSEYINIGIFSNDFKYS